VFRSATLIPLSTYEERLIKSLTEAIAAATTAANGLRYTVAAQGQSNHMMVTRCDLSAAEARLAALIMANQGSVDLSPLAALVVRAEKISSTLKALAVKFTQLDSSTDSNNQTAP
jgi:hypothetical protein